MRTSGGALWLVLALVAVTASGLAGEATSYGDGVTASKAVPIADLLANPDDYVGRKVRVDGSITDVCPKMGCWLQITDDGGRHMRFKVDDGVIVFSVDLKGRPVSAEGEFVKIEMDRERAIAYYEHLAEEKKEPFDPETVKPPYVLYQLSGTGAVVR